MTQTYVYIWRYALRKGGNGCGTRRSAADIIIYSALGQNRRWLPLRAISVFDRGKVINIAVFGSLGQGGGVRTDDSRWRSLKATVSAGRSDRA